MYKTRSTWLCGRKIKKDKEINKNGIHSFEEQTIGAWYDLQYCVRFWCYLLGGILNRLP